MTYKTRHGLDWPAEMPDVLIDLTIGKKWKLLEQTLGVKIKDPWVPMLDAARALIPEDLFKVSEWTEQHFHDFVTYDKLITWGCASSSKAQPLYSTVMTPKGPKKMGDMKVGDEVVTPDGRATVVKINDVGERDVCVVRMRDGGTCECAPDHLWTVAERSGAWQTITTDAMAEKIAAGAILRIPQIAPVNYASAHVPLDPYVLGLLIGDGTLGGSDMKHTAVFTSKDEDIVDELRGRLLPGYALMREPACPEHYRLTNTRVDTCKANYYKTVLAALGLWGKGSADKYIPDNYKYNDEATRREVLSGLLDTDGGVRHDVHNGAHFDSVSKRLAEDVMEIVRSLGGSASMHSYLPHFTGRDGVRKEGQRAYRVNIRIDGLKSLFKCKRKQDAVHEGVGHRKDRIVVSVEKPGRREKMQCITLSDPRGLYMTDNLIVTHNSNDTALLLVLDWVVDPYDTVTLLGSTTKEDLKSRSWEGVERYHHALRNNKLGFLVPGKISKQGQKLINHDEDDVAGSSGEKAGIQGRAINEGGRLQGAHAKYVRLVVDELAEISNHEAIKTAIANLRVGTTSFKFIGLANPESWDNPSCQYCEPLQGRDKVDVDTGSWMSTFGCFVRHHDGLKSPCVKDPSLRSKFPFLMSQDEYDSVLREAGGNPDAPQIWKMIRGFPVPLGTMIPTVLDPKVAAENRVGELIPEAHMYPPVAVAAGIDPAWSEGGDGAYHCKVVVRMVNGKPVLDFGGGLTRLTISATDSRPVTKQLRDQVIQLMRTPGSSPILRNTAIDSSGNQGLADDLDITLSDSCLHVNSSQRASELPLRATDNRKVKEIVYDRGTEAWAVLAEFCRAGMVRGLPPEALTQITQRRYACRNGTTAQLFPLRMEAKDKFRVRFKKSPDEADACALAALAVKERLGILPFSFVMPKEASVDDVAFLGQLAAPDNLIDLPIAGEYEDYFDYGAYEPI